MSAHPSMVVERVSEGSGEEGVFVTTPLVYVRPFGNRTNFVGLTRPSVSEKSKEKLGSKGALEVKSQSPERAEKIRFRNAPLSY